MTEGDVTKKRSITITFNKKIGVALIMSLEEYTKEECQLAWFQAEEYTQMEDECEFTSEFLQKKKMLPPALCGRGLEGWTVEGEKLKDKHVGLAVELVWQAQLAHWTNVKQGEEEGNASTSDVSIAQEYEQITVPCHQAAHLIGLSDEKEVKRYLAPIKQMEKTRRKMQSLLAKPTSGSVPQLKPAIRTSKTPKQSRHKTPNGHHSPESNASSPMHVTKKMGGLDLLDKIEKRIAEAPMYRAGHKSNATVGSNASSSITNNSAPPSPSDKSVKSIRKIDFRAKGRTGVPLSPVGSLHSSGEFSSGSRRHFSSHSSVCSSDEGSVRRRMLKAAAPLKL